MAAEKTQYTDEVRSKLIEEYWLGKFDAAEQVLTGGGNRARETCTYRAFLDARTADGTRRIAQGKDAGEYILYVAAYHLLLQRYFSGASFLIAADDLQTRGGETLPDSVLFFKIAAAGAQPVKEVIKATQAEVLGAFNYRNYAYATLRKEFAHRRIVEDALWQFGFTCRPLTGEAAAVQKASLHLHLEKRTDGGMELRLTCDASRADARLFAGFLRHYAHLVENLTALLERPVDAIDLLSPEETHRQVVGFNGRVVPYPHDQTPVDLFEQQVSRTPDALAVVSAGGSLTYGELNAKANRLAHHLRQEQGVGPGSLVGIMVDRSEWMILGIMAILKAGGAYVPLDAQYPADRISYIVGDTGLTTLLIQSEYLERTTGFEGYLFALDIQLAMLTEPDTNPVRLHAPGDLAYVLYTSGSTGRPKGVMIEHGHILNLVAGLDEAVYDQPEKKLRVALVAAYVFDASVQQIFPALVRGHTLCIAPDQSKMSGEALWAFYADYGIEVTDGTPLHLLMLARAPIPAGTFPLRHLIIGGDVLTGQCIQTFFDNVSANRDRFTDPDQVRVTNVYGPTECCVDATYYSVNRHEIATQYGVPIGKPLANRKIYVLTAAGQLQPEGVPGEICIAGAGVARGYFNNAGLTTEKFTADPFGQPGERMYKTGDFGRWLPGGILEFTGRKDTQVKIRGYRIEIGEIENTLLNYKTIKQAVVAAPTDHDGSKYLAAYVVADGELNANAVRTFLKASLPEYMVPGFIIPLKRLPLTINGKLDVKALPDPNSVAGGQSSPYVGPGTPIEEQLVRIWEDVLGRNSISVHANFFELGGHSLKATQVVSRIHKELDLKVELISLFTHPTIHELAGLLAKAAKEHYQSIEPLAPAPDYALSHAQRRLWILDQFTPGQVAYNMSGAFPLEGLDVAAFGQALALLVARHESLRTRFVVREGEARQVVESFENCPFQLHCQDLRQQPQPLEAARQLAAREAATPFDLASGPLLRASLLQVAPDRHVLLLTLHHIISDGWSMQVLVREVLTLYAACAKGEANPLPPLRIHYKDFAHWQNQLLQGEALEGHRRYWMEQFEGPLPVLELPADYPRPPVQTYRGARLEFELGRELSQGLGQLARRQGASLFMVLLASVKGLLYRYTGQQDLTIGTPIAGREHLDLEGQIGFYINTLALRTRLSGTSSFTDLLAQVRTTTLEAYQHQVYPFDKLVEDLQLERDLSRNPLFDVMVGLQNTDQEAFPEPPGLSIGELPDGEVLSKFDLSIDFREVGEAIAVYVVYRPDLFSKRRMVTMKDDLVRFCQAAVAAPDARLHELPVFGDRENEMLALWSRALGIPAANLRLSDNYFDLDATRSKLPELLRLINSQYRVTLAEEDLRLFGSADRLLLYISQVGSTGDNTPVTVPIDRRRRQIQL